MFIIWVVIGFLMLSLIWGFLLFGLKGVNCWICVYRFWVSWFGVKVRVIFNGGFCCWLKFCVVIFLFKVVCRGVVVVNLKDIL